LDLAVPRGELVGFIGPNGAGKTTSIRMIMSILFPDKGELEVLGKKSAVESKDRIGYLPEERGVYKKMKVGKFLEHMAGLKNAQGDVPTKISQWLERVELPGVRNKKCEELSKGMQQKVQFIASVIHEPELLILDEPFSGLDPVNMRLLRELIRDQKNAGVTVLFSTHVMVHAEQVCDHVMMIHNGKKMLDGSMGEIRSQYDTRTIAFEPATGVEVPGGIEVAGITAIARDEDGDWRATVADDCEPAAAIASLTSQVPVTKVEVHRPTLEDIFIDIVTADTAASGQSEEQLRAAVRAGASAIGAEESDAAVAGGAK
ncbi:MAG: ATP-binding cassette domain-containing protein, partial [Planctomycetota bacterium]